MLFVVKKFFSLVLEEGRGNDPRTILSIPMVFKTTLCPARYPPLEGGLGIEPNPRNSKFLVLPLHHTPIKFLQYQYLSPKGTGLIA